MEVVVSMVVVVVVGLFCGPVAVVVMVGGFDLMHTRGYQMHDMRAFDKHAVPYQAALHAFAYNT